MPLTIPDDILKQAGLTENEARVEVACRLFDAGKLALWPAAEWADLTRVEFEQELLVRNIAVYRPTRQDLEAEVSALDRLGL